MESFRGRRALQRLFSTFPGGSPGVGLLLLRVAVGGAATVQGVLCLSGFANHAIGVCIIDLTLILCGLALTVGLLTPLAGLFVGLCASGIALSWIPVPPFPLLDSKLVNCGMIITTVAIALLGPGAFSFDGYLFGRREIVIPPRLPDS